MNTSRYSPATPLVDWNISAANRSNRKAQAIDSRGGGAQKR